MRGLHLPPPLQLTRRSAVLLIVLAVLLACAGTGAYLAAPSAAAALTGASVTVNSGGLVLTMRTARGPYFLRELLPVSVSLTNHTGATVQVPRGACLGVYGGAFYVTESGGGAPTYQLPVVPGAFSGPGIIESDDLAPGQTCTTPDVLLPLTASGQITLTAHAALTSITMVGGVKSLTILDPFADHEPTLALNVDASAPPDRTLNVLRHTSRVIVLGPPGALLHLEAMFAATAGGCMTGDFSWEPLRMPVLDAHPCAGVYGTWSYAIGAPGYAIASETLSASQIQ
jgi:hypothetical protein